MYESITKFLNTAESFLSTGEFDSQAYREFEHQFIEAFYTLVDDNPELQLKQYHEILGKELIIIHNTEEADGVDVSSLDGQTVAALIMFIMRADHFCEGAITDAFSTGVMQKWIRRLQEIDQHAKEETSNTTYGQPIGTIEVHRNSITHLRTDAIVNAANSGLNKGGGVCGAIFKAAGVAKLTAACKAIGHCNLGDAVTTPAFNLQNNKYIIHAVGPIFNDGKSGEADILYNCYQSALREAKNAGCRSIGFPLISAGVFGYPIDEAWWIALRACSNFLSANPNYELNIVFVNPDAEIANRGKTLLHNLQEREQNKVAKSTVKQHADEPIEVIDADEFEAIAAEIAKNVPEVAKPLLRNAELAFNKIEEMLYKAPAFINAVKASIPEIRLEAVLTPEQQDALRDGVLKLMTKADGTLLAKIIDPESKKIIKNIPLKEVKFTPDMDQAMANYSTQMQLAQIAKQIKVVQKAVEEVRQGQEHDRLATAYSCQQKLLQAREIRNPELRAMALMRLASDAEDSRNLLMLSQKTNVDFLMSQPEGFWGKLLGDAASNDEIDKRMNEIRDSLNAVNLVSLSEAMAYQELGEPEAANRSIAYYGAFIQDTYLTAPGLVDRLDMIDPAPMNYWTKTLPDIDKKINALPGLTNITQIEEWKNEEEKSS